MTGKIVRIMRDKNFGFIKGDHGSEEYFFHASALKNAKFEDVEEGQEVTFEDADTAKGPRAEDVFV